MEKNLQHATLHYVAHIVLAVLHKVFKFQESPIYHGHSPQMNRKKLELLWTGMISLETCICILAH